MENLELSFDAWIALIALSVGLLLVLGFLLRIRLRGGEVSHCPLCASERIRRATLQPRDEWLIYARIIPIRCEACKKRFFAIRSVRIGSESQSLGPAGPRHIAG